MSETPEKTKTGDNGFRRALIMLAIAFAIGYVWIQVRQAANPSPEVCVSQVDDALLSRLARSDLQLAPLTSEAVKSSDLGDPPADVEGLTQAGVCRALVTADEANLDGDPATIWVYVQEGDVPADKDTELILKVTDGESNEVLVESVVKPVE